MGQTHNESITLVAGEALEPYRRVKYDGVTAGVVVYADAADGDSWIGVTMPNVAGDGVASGDQVTIELRGEHKTLKMECSAAVTGNASIYPEDDGKISDDAGTVVIGTAAGEGTGAGSGSIIEVHPNAGSGSVPDEEAIANADATTGVGIVISLNLTATATGTTEIPTPDRKIRVINAWAQNRGTTDSDVDLLNGANTMTRAAVAVGTTADVFKQLDITDAYDEIAADGSLYANLATAESTGVEFNVLAVPIA